MIETSRLFIRAFNEADREMMINLLQDHVFMEYSDSGAFDKEGANKRFDQILSYTATGLGKRAIVLKETGDIIGYCGIEPFSVQGHDESELGYRLVEKYRGLGIATEAALAVSSSHQGRLFAYVHRENTKSTKVLAKIGFSRRGTCSVQGKEYELYQKEA